MEWAFHALTRPSLQARVLAAARPARAASVDCARCTPDAFAGSRTSNPGAVPPTRPALSIGYPGSRDRSAAALVASGAAVPSGTSLTHSRSAWEFGAGDGMTYRSTHTV